VPRVARTVPQTKPESYFGGRTKRLRNGSKKEKAKEKKDEELGFSEEIKDAIGLIDSDDFSSDESEASSSTSNPHVPSKCKRLLDDGPDANSDANSEGKGSGTANDPEDYEISGVLSSVWYILYTTKVL